MTHSATQVQHRLNAVAQRHAAIQIDKCNNEWVLTQWLHAETALRIRIRHSGPPQPSEFFCEVADIATDHEFRLVGHFLWRRDDDRELWEWPSEWRNQFLNLARVWAKCLELGEWGIALGSTPIVRDEPDESGGPADRYHGATASRRDASEVVHA
jgi:hypothetical protein